MLEFGPGLNVLYGPNDLGKSSLAWAIRAVLLMQHNSAEHERFVSWYGPGEPRVALTICDDDERYWRVTKCFAKGAAGRSTLESSKDGRHFLAEASGRQTDERLRDLLRLGVHRPGGRGAPRGVPKSFLTQVLLADQDDVRKILFEGSLAEDQDESGRLRLTEALGALAQDPLFKRVLEEAQSRADRAFMANGQRRRGAGAPFVAVAERVRELDRERAHLDQKVRETTAAEERILRLIEQRDEASRDLEDATTALQSIVRQAEARARWEALNQAREKHAAVLAGAARLEGGIKEKELQEQRLEANLRSLELRIAQARADLDRADERESVARAALDALAAMDSAELVRKNRLEEDVKELLEQIHELDRGVERSEGALREATRVAHRVKELRSRVASFELTAGQASAASAQAIAAEEGARTALDDAQQRLREATSDDHARARELRRRSLDNKRLARAADGVEAERALERARAVGDLLEAAERARASHQRQVAALREANDRLVAARAALGGVDEAIAEAQRVAQYGDLLRARQLMAAAHEARNRIGGLRSAASECRDRARTLRASVPAGLPASGDLDALRRLREDLRVAEAGLSAVSVTIRPLRSISVRETRDGVTEPARTIDAPISLSAQHDLVLALDQVAEIEVSGGDEVARASAARLRQQWNQAGVTLLGAIGVESLDELLQLRQEADGAERAAVDCDRDAERAEAEAAQLAASIDPRCEERVVSLEAALEGCDESALGATLAGLGRDPPAALEARLASLGEERQRHLADIERHRDLVARGEAALEPLARAAEGLQAQAKHDAEALSEPWNDLSARHTAQIDQVSKDLAAIDRELAELLASGSEEAGRVQAALQRCERSLAGARERVQATGQEARVAGEALAAESALLDAARREARVIDVGGAWAQALDRNGDELPLEHWQAALDRAVQAREERTRQLAAVCDQIRRIDRDRALALDAAREAVAGAGEEVKAASAKLEEHRQADQRSRDDLAHLKAELAADRIDLARANLEEARTQIDALSAQLSSLGAVSPVGPEDVARQQGIVDRLSLTARDHEDELARARGALEQVGGATVRERMTEIERALEQAVEQQHSIEIEYEGWRLLVEALREAENSESGHLGHMLAGPVSERFRQLTEGRYGAVELGTHLEPEGLRVAGDIREISTLSAGTQDQLATLLRLCIAEQLRSCIILDDHLSQSDPARVAWFNETLRRASHALQVIFITCRPAELLAGDELAGPAEAIRTSAAGQMRAIDLSRVIRRFANGAASDGTEVAREPGHHEGPQSQRAT